MENSDISQRFARDGYVFPLDVMSRQQAAAYRRDLETLQQQSCDSKLGNKGQLNYAHVICRFAHAIVTHPTILYPGSVIKTHRDGFAWLSDDVAPVLRCPASLRRARLAENHAKPSLWVFITDPWYNYPF